MDDKTYNYVYDAMCWVLDMLDDLSIPGYEEQYHKLDTAIDKFYTWYQTKGSKNG